MSDLFPESAESDADSFQLIQFIALLGIEPQSAATFRPASGAPLDHAWDVWQRELFLPILAPAFIEAYQATASYQIQDLITADQRLDASIPRLLKSKSLEAARPFLTGKGEMKAHREWLRFTESIDQGTTPGHLGTLFAAQSALYHLPLTSALVAYASFEFRSRTATFPFPALTEAENRIFSTILPLIPLAVHGKSSENQDSANPHSLRAI